MKLTSTLLALLCSFTTTLAFAEPKHTADAILVNAPQSEGKEVSVDVMFVKPVRWKSPDPDFAFFHAETVDRHDKKIGGSILVVVPATEAVKFAKHYGIESNGRNESDKLTGILTTSPSKRVKTRTWMIDTTEGKFAETVKAKKLTIDDTDGKEADKKEGEKK
jgi:hypothetical protein